MSTVDNTTDNSNSPAPGSLPSIKQLSASVVNKIAAGEVIERPASIVKELMENSVDAGATRIDVVIEKGGADSIQVTDNGYGIRCNELELAVASHATSKIRDADDLFDVHTLGFRGEALASIAEISQFTLKTRTADSDSGCELQVVGGQHEGVKPCASPVGTTVIVEQLFYNTPVRRKFLKTTQTEMSHITEAFTRIALANDHIHFTLRHNQKTVYDLAACDDWRKRIGDFFGDEIRQALIPVENETAGISLIGYVVDPTHSRGHNRMQYLFLNGRHIRDRSLQHALAESYRGLLLTGRFPIAYLKLKMNADRVDVNVHPCKLEVRFQDGSRLYSQLLGTVRNKFLTTDLTARQNLGNETRQSAIQSPPIPAAQDTLGFQTSQSNYDWTSAPRATSSPSSNPSSSPASASSHFSSDNRPGPGSNDGRAMPRPDAPATQPAGSPSWHEQIDQQIGRGDPSAVSTDIVDNPFDAPAQYHASEPHTHEPHAHEQKPPVGGLQIHNRYLVTQSAEGIVVIDQHALHERVIYEQLREKVLNGKLESQRLLVPEPVNLAPAESAVVLDARKDLAQIGILIEPFGGDTVIVQAYPAMLANHNPSEMLRHVVEVLMETQRELEQRDIIDELLHMISCKAAVKAGDKLSPEEITALLQHRELCQDSHHCPHGRPTSLVFSREELDKRFKRI